MKNQNKKLLGFFNIELSIVLVLVALAFYVFYSINDSIVSYGEIRTKLAKTNTELIEAKSTIDNQKIQIINLNKEIALTHQSYEELLAKKEKVVEKVTKVSNKRAAKEKAVVDSDVQLKVSGTLSEESLTKLSEIRSTDLVEHYSVLFNETNQPSI